MTPELTEKQRERRDDAVCVMQDLPLLWIDARCAGATMKRRPDALVSAASSEPAAVVDRIETELHGEATRYRHALWACVAVSVMPAALAMLAWSGLYWLPVRIMWFPFERGYYGLPWFSLYEWVAYLMLAAFFAYGFALIAESKASTHRLSADYRRLAEGSAEFRAEVVESVVATKADRTSLVLRRSRPFAEYIPLLDATAPDDDSQAAADAASAWPVRHTLALVLGVLAANLLAGRAVRTTAGAALSATSAALAVIAIFAVLYALEIGVIGAVARTRNATLAEAVGMRAVDGPVAWLGIALGAGLGLRIISTIYSVVMLAMGWRLPGWDADPTRFFPHTPLGGLAMVLVVAIGAPIAEETVFRGIVLPSAMAKWGAALGVLVTSLVFAAMHLSVFAFLPILAVAWVLASLRMRSGSLWPAIVCHATFNCIGIILVLVLRGSGIV